MKKVMWVVALLTTGAVFAIGYWYGSYRTSQAMMPNYLLGDQFKVVRTKGGMIEVATLVKGEAFDWKVSWTCPGGVCSGLPTSTSRLSATAHYTYRIKLDDFWVLEKKSGTSSSYVLKVPRLEPFSPVAVDLQSIKVQNSGSIFAPGGPELEKMQAQLQPLLMQRALSQDYIKAQQEGATKTIIEFALKWMRDGDMKLPADASIEVVFGK